MVDVSVIIVSYNTKVLLRQCLASALAARSLSVEVFVVDNGSTDGSPAMVAEEFPTVRLIGNAGNAGFAGANNQALRLARGEFALLLNPDAELCHRSLDSMVGHARSQWNVGVVGPRLVFGDGQQQPSRRRFPTLATLFVESTIVQRIAPGARLLRSFYLADTPDDVTQDVDWLVGACLLVRRAAIEQVGLLDERFFMYSEETDWCRRIKAAGWRVVYLPEAVVVHHEARSSEQNLARRNIAFNDSKCRYAAKHFGPAAGLALRAFILATFAYQFAEELAKLALGHKRDLRRERLAMLRQVIAWQARHLVEVRT